QVHFPRIGPACLERLPVLAIPRQSKHRCGGRRAMLYRSLVQLLLARLPRGLGEDTGFGG
ncbi:MAG: hypothetical protein J0I57_21210, partial [Hyphomicrobium sp.]|nr:hypothetical protein [Hyphomicrobium sp.]